MKNFVYLYHSTQTTPPSPDALEAFGTWFASLGDKVVDGGNPIKKDSQVVVRNGASTPGSDTIIGYAIIKADSLQEAVQMAMGNPLAHSDDSAVHVYETAQM